jgi:hypothetical protein
MPFKPEEETNVTTYIVRKEIETIREVPFFPDKMEKLILTNLIVTKNIEIPDPTIFYRPNPEKLSNSFLNFCTPSNIVEFKINDSAFLTFDEKDRQIHSSKIGCSTLNADIVQSKRAEFDELIIPSLTVSTISADVIKVGRIESAPANDIGGVLLKDGTINANTIQVGNTVSVCGNIGGCSLKNKNIWASDVNVINLNAATISCGLIACDRLVCDVKHITLGGVRFSDGNIKIGNLDASTINTNTIETKSVRTDTIITTNIETKNIKLETLDLFGTNNRLSVSGGLYIPVSHISEIGKLKLTKDLAVLDVPFHVKSIETTVAKLGCVSISDGVLVSGNVTISGDISADRVETRQIKTESVLTSTINASEVHASQITAHAISAGYVKAADFRLNDGTSILNGVFPVGMIMLFQGKIPPRGWLECNGKCGTPTLLAPTDGVIYIVRR